MKKVMIAFLEFVATLGSSETHDFLHMARTYYFDFEWNYGWQKDMYSV